MTHGIYLSICIYIYLSIYQFFLSICHILSKIYLYYIYLSIYPLILSIYLSIPLNYLSIPYFHLCMYISSYLSLYLSLFLSIYLEPTASLWPRSRASSPASPPGRRTRLSWRWPRRHFRRRQAASLIKPG